MGDKLKSRQGIIYKATNVRNGKCYVGKSTKSLQRRRTEHVSKNNQVNTVFKKAIEKYGKESFTWEVLETCSIELLDEREKYYIEQCESLITQHGYNMTLGGDGAPYGELNPSKRLEVREKLRRANTGFKHTPETLRIMGEKSRAYYSKGMPKEQREKIGRALIGRKGHTKMKQQYRFVSPDGKLFEVMGVREFAREHNLDHSALVKLSKGKLKTHKGWRLG